MENDFKKFKNYNNIFVTGCQRSGTKLLAQIIAKETKKTYIEEHQFDVHNLDDLQKVLKKGDCNIIQCPALSIYLEFMIANNIIKKEDCVVWITRNKKDVYASMDRINWGGLTESAKYSFYFEREEDNDIWEIKNRVWNMFQRPFLEENAIDFFDIAYEDLKSHSLWKSPKERRKND